MNPRDDVRDYFSNKFGFSPQFIGHAPGRINLLGEHVDYNQGFVIPAAIDRETFIAFSPSKLPFSTVWAADFDEMVRFSENILISRTQIDGKILPEWAWYPAGVMWSLKLSGLSVEPINAVISSNVPRGSGLSSSASVEMAFIIAWQKIGGWHRAPLELAQISQRAEVGYVGLNCGIMDQFASACGQKDHLLFLDCRSFEWKSLKLSSDLVIVAADTSVRRKLTRGEYNNRHDACDQAVKLLKTKLPNIKSLRDVSVADFYEFRNILPGEVQKRARHVVEEIARTQKAFALIENGNFGDFGELMNACHASLRDLYEVSSPELNLMVEIAQYIKGCYGARLTGAGFGGCTVNLVDRKLAEEFAIELGIRYKEASGLNPEILICRASDGASMDE